MCSDLQSVFGLAPPHVHGRAFLTKRRMLAQEMLRHDHDLSHTTQDLDSARTADSPAQVRPCTQRFSSCETHSEAMKLMITLDTSQQGMLLCVPVCASAKSVTNPTAATRTLHLQLSRPTTGPAAFRWAARVFPREKQRRMKSLV